MLTLSCKMRKYSSIEKVEFYGAVNEGHEARELMKFSAGFFGLGVGCIAIGSVRHIGDINVGLPPDSNRGNYY